MDHQDWNQVLLKRTLTDKEQKAKFGSETKAKRVDTSGVAKQKLDGETETFHHNKVPNEKRMEIFRLRSEKKLTQKQLAQKCNMPISDISSIESGHAIYDHNKVQKILRVLRPKR